MVQRRPKKHGGTGVAFHPSERAGRLFRRGIHITNCPYEIPTALRFPLLFCVFFLIYVHFTSLRGVFTHTRSWTEFFLHRRGLFYNTASTCRLSTQHNTTCTRHSPRCRTPRARRAQPSLAKTMKAFIGGQVPTRRPSTSGSRHHATRRACSTSPRCDRCSCTSPRPRPRGSTRSPHSPWGVPRGSILPRWRRVWAAGRWRLLAGRALLRGLRSWC